MRESARRTSQIPRINFRPVLFCALSLAFGIFLYGDIAFGTFTVSDVLFTALFLLFSLRPFSRKRILAIAVCFLVCSLAGAGLIHLYTQRFTAEKEGEYRLSGTVTSVTVYGGYSSAVLSDLYLDGEHTRGKCRIMLGEEIRAGDVLVMTAEITPVGTDSLADSSYTRSLFVANVRYTASASSYEKTGTSKNIFLKLNALLFDTLYENMGGNEASLSYALLTGNSGGIDSGLLTQIRQGGIAHIFAVSGLHIGILYAAAYFCFRPLGRYRFLPALFLAFCYAGVCCFTVSSVRALVMCGTLGAFRVSGRKTDFLNNIAFAAFATLLFSPAQWFSVGFRLSYGACLGLALFSGSISRFLEKRAAWFPRAARGYLSAGLSVQIFTFPILLEAFGYVSVWGILLNLLIVPFVPVLFLGLIVCVLFALAVPPAAAFFLSFPASMFSLLLFMFSVVDFSLVLTGFALGAGAVVWLIGCVGLSQRVRMERKGRVCAAVFLAAVLALCLVAENVVLSGCRISVYDSNGSSAVLIRTKDESVLVIDGDITLSECRDFLSRRYGGTLSLVIVLAEDEVAAINVAAFLDAEEIFARKECETGLRNTAVSFGGDIVLGTLVFRYESAGKIVLLTENIAVEIDFEEEEALSADLFLGEGIENLNFYLKDGIIKTR